jgi:hypothetical protein
LVPAMEMAAACKRVDIVISDRWLPYSCKPRWFKADRAFLEMSGGLAFYFDEARVRSVAETTAHYPWARFKRPNAYPKERKRSLNDSGATAPPACPEPRHPRAHNIAAHSDCWRDQAGLEFHHGEDI